MEINMLAELSKLKAGNKIPENIFHNLNKANVSFGLVSEEI